MATNSHDHGILDDQAFRRIFPHPLIPTNLKGAYAIPAHSQDFDPNGADPGDLQKHGIYWQRPRPTDNPSLIEAWRKFYSRRWHYITPSLEPQTGKTHLLGKRVKPIADYNYLNTIWAGAGLQAGMQGGPWTAIMGYWHIPTVSTPPLAPNEYRGYGWSCSSWLGLDGGSPYITSNDVLQAGVQQAVGLSGQATYVPWFEWYAPSNVYPPTPLYIDQTNITNLPVVPGQEMLCIVQYIPLPYIGNLGLIILANVTTGDAAQIFLAPPPGATAAGNTVEWILESATVLNLGFEPALPQFTPVVFTSAVAYGPNNSTVGNPQYGNTYNINAQDPFTLGDWICTSVTTGNETVSISFLPPSM
jgi:Peptidase A4 family